MSKWFGKIGFYDTVDKGDGIYDDVIEERNYYGDVSRNTRHYTQNNEVNPDISASVQISIISDQYVNQHLSNIKYVDYMGDKWMVTEIDPMNYPRLVLTLGGVYNGVTSDETP